ncbi:hypothetical protein Tco_1497712, partial [Tanacetum coccineum]
MARARKIIIKAQQQHVADVHPDELCPPNKRYDLMDANKKIDFEQVQCLPESKLLTNIIKNHPLRFSIAASSSKELSITLDDFRIILHLPQATNNNHDSFVPPPSFLDMVPFYKNELGFTMEMKTSSSFKTTGLLQLWQTKDFIILFIIQHLHVEEYFDDAHEDDENNHSNGNVVKRGITR